MMGGEIRGGYASSNPDVLAVGSQAADLSMATEGSEQTADLHTRRYQITLFGWLCRLTYRGLSVFLKFSLGIHNLTTTRTVADIRIWRV